MDTSRLCACGCRRTIPPDAPARRTWFDQACKQRGYRVAENHRRAARAASVAAAVAGQGDLVDVFQEAVRAARARPGSVLLRVAGRLVPLAEHQLTRLAEGLRRPEPTEPTEPPPNEVMRDLQAEARACARSPTRSGGLLVPTERFTALQALIFRLDQSLRQIKETDRSVGSPRSVAGVAELRAAAEQLAQELRHRLAARVTLPRAPVVQLLAAAEMVVEAANPAPPTDPTAARTLAIVGVLDEVLVDVARLGTWPALSDGEVRLVPTADIVALQARVDRLAALLAPRSR